MTEALRSRTAGVALKDPSVRGDAGSMPRWVAPARVVWYVFRQKLPFSLTIDDAAHVHLTDGGGYAQPGSLKVRVRSHQQRLVAHITPITSGRSLRLDASPPVFRAHIQEHEGLVISGTIKETPANALLPWACVLMIAVSFEFVFLAATSPEGAGTRVLLLIMGVGLGAWMVPLLVVVVRGRRRRFNDQAATLRGSLNTYLHAGGSR
ncbi:MAG: hypothetical protein ACR2LX_12440 [Jatrophihabitans sp.]